MGQDFDLLSVFVYDYRISILNMTKSVPIALNRCILMQTNLNY